MVSGSLATNVYGVPFGPVWMPTVEDVIVTKLLWATRAGRLKDQDDCRGVIAVQGNLVDWEYVGRWCDHRGQRPLDVGAQARGQRRRQEAEEGNGQELAIRSRTAKAVRRGNSVNLSGSS